MIPRTILRLSLSLTSLALPSPPRVHNDYSGQPLSSSPSSVTKLSPTNLVLQVCPIGARSFTCTDANVLPRLYMLAPKQFQPIL